MSNQMFRCGDVVKGFPHYSKEPELGVILRSSSSTSKSSRYQYSINWQHSAPQSWFKENDLELVQKCLISVRRDEI